MNDTQPAAGEQRYYERLAEFTQICQSLTGRGAPYFAVVLCHELFRFLYPSEPYAGFENRKDPVADAVARIEKLIALGRRFGDCVTPYAFDPALQGGDWKAEVLETSTSNLYSELWGKFDRDTLTRESVRLLEARLPGDVIARSISGRAALDMGCGSGRYTLALAQLGAARVTGVDFQAKAFRAAESWAQQQGLPVEFKEANVLELPFPDASFDFVLCNGVIHHSASIKRGLDEIARVLKPGGTAFLYLYAAGGIFWTTRRALRAVFERIPLHYTEAVLRTMGMPSNRFVFCDTWYVPVETHTTTAELEQLLESAGLLAQKLPGRNPFDLDGAIEEGIRGGREMWGDGEHRYLLTFRDAVVPQVS